MNRAIRTLIFAAVAATSATAAYSQSSSSNPSQSQAPSQTPSQTQSQAPGRTGSSATPAQPANGTYIASDPLSAVRYDNRWDVSVGMAFGHIHAGPTIREGADLGGLDLSASYWLSKRLGLEASGRGYLGTSGTTPAANAIGESGVFVAQYMFLAGPEYLGPHNKHGAIILHALVGGAYGDFNTDLTNTPLIPGQPKTGPSGPAGFYDNQVALGGAFGGHIDLNRSPRLVFRITPDALLTGYDGGAGQSHTQWNFGISVGAEYKFKKRR